jgi:two-component system response regulator EvgA
MSVSCPTRIVVADSNPLAVDVLCSQLSACGYLVVAETTDGHEAVALARDLFPDVVVIAVDLAELDGLEASKRIDREAPCPIVLLGQCDDAALAHQASAIASVWGCLTRPENERSLEAAIDWALASVEEDEPCEHQIYLARDAVFA